jgi:hypothetical protein
MNHPKRKVAEKRRITIKDLRARNAVKGGDTAQAGQSPMNTNVMKKLDSTQETVIQNFKG